MTGSTDVLIVGGGPVGLQMALELQRRGVDHVVIDQRPSPDSYCKALGVTPRTLEVWEQCGVLDEALRRGAFLLGIESRTNQGESTREEIEHGRLPYGFLTLPQYDTEEILRAALRRHGDAVEQGVRLVDLAQRRDGVTVRSIDASGRESVIECRYLVGCDGAHSTVRRALGIEYEGDSYPMTFMLGDVLVHWDRPHGYGQRITHLENGELRNVIVFIPIPGDPRRYRVSMAAPPELQSDAADLGTPPSLETLQIAVAPVLSADVTISDLRWSSYYRISHRIVSRYASGRCFLAGDAAHIHPPIGGQGMNTGIQDAQNLAWKLALAVAGRAAPGLLDSYGEERRRVGLDVVERTTRRMDEAVTTGDLEFDQWMQDSQLLIHHRDSGVVEEDVTAGVLGMAPRAGERAPDASGLRLDWVDHPIRLAERMRGGGHLLLLYFDATASAADFARAADLADAIAARHGGDIAIDAILATAAKAADDERFPLLRDAAGGFRSAYGADRSCLYLIRPDRYVGYRAAGHDLGRLGRYLERIFAAQR